MKFRGFRLAKPANVVAIAGGAVFSLASVGLAQTTTWQGAASSWFTSGNWNNGVPNSSVTATVDNGGTAQISSGTAAAQTLVLGASSTGTLALSNTGSLTALEYIGESGDGIFNQTGGTNNASEIEMATGDLGAVGSYTLSGGTLDAGSAYIGYEGAATFSQTGGTLAVTSVLQLTSSGSSLSIANATDTSVTVNNYRTLSLVGASGASTAGNLTVSGNYDSSTGTELNIGLGGAIAGSQYSQLNVTGTATLLGILDVSLSNGFLPSPGETFNIINATSRSSTFSTVELPTGLSYPLEINYTSSGVVLHYLPEPASGGVLAVAVLNLLRRRRRA